MDLFEAMETCRAVRRFKTDTVPDELVERIVWAATRAPSPGNSQLYGFVVATRRESLRAIGQAVTEALRPVADAPRPEDPSQRAMIDGTLHMAANLEHIPALVVAGAYNGYPPAQPNRAFVYSAIYPAVQNLLLAARALGIGTTLTTWHLLAGPTIRETLGIPDEVHIGAVVPMGWPEQPFIPVRRVPVDQVLHREVWRTPSGR